MGTYNATATGSPTIVAGNTGFSNCLQGNGAGSGYYTTPTILLNKPCTLEGFVSSAYTGTANTTTLLGHSGAFQIGVRNKVLQVVLTGMTVNLTGTTIINNGTWHHFAVTCDSSNQARLWLDGNLEAGPVSTGVAQPIGNGAIRLGDYNASAIYSMSTNTFLDSVRLSNIVQYTGPFTPPAVPFSSSTTGALALFQLDTDGTDSNVPIVTLTPGVVSVYSMTPANITLQSAFATLGTAPYNYQYQTSPDGTTFTNAGSSQNGIAAGVAPANYSYAATAGQTEYFRVKVTDSVASTVNSASVKVTNPLTTDVVGDIGDSIRYGYPSGGNFAPSYTFLQAGSVTIPGLQITNQAVSGTTTTDWLPAGSLLTPAINAMRAFGVKWVFVCLGTNDSKAATHVSVASYLANMTLIVNALTAAGFTVLISYPIWLVSPGLAGVWDATSVSLMQQYQGAINSLMNGTTVLPGDRRGWTWFFSNTGKLNDLTHPTTAGYQDLGMLTLDAYRIATGRASPFRRSVAVLGSGGMG